MDGTEKLCLKLYGEEKPEHYINGSNSKMLHDAVAKIEELEQRLETGHNDTLVNLRESFIEEQKKVDKIREEMEGRPDVITMYDGVWQGIQKCLDYLPDKNHQTN